MADGFLTDGGLGRIIGGIVFVVGMTLFLGIVHGCPKNVQLGQSVEFISDNDIYMEPSQGLQYRNITPVHVQAPHDVVVTASASQGGKFLNFQWTVRSKAKISAQVGQNATLGTHEIIITWPSGLETKRKIIITEQK